MKLIRGLPLLGLVIIYLSLVKNIHAHPGRTDSSGCHTCKTNCDSWGLNYGEYHCHNGGSTGGTSTQQLYVAPTSPPYIPPTTKPTAKLTIKPTSTPTSPANTPEPTLTSTPTQKAENTLVDQEEHTTNKAETADMGSALSGLSALGGGGYLLWRKLKKN